MKESGVFYVPQNPMGKGRGNKIRNLHIASASINTSWMKAGLTHPTKSNKILNKSAQSCQEWLTFICFCRNFKDLKQMTGQFDVCVVEDKLGCHFTFVSTMQTLWVRCCRGWSVPPVVAVILTDLLNQRKLRQVSEPEQPENNTFFSNI